MNITSLNNPIHSLQNWHQGQTKTPAYSQAVKSFEEDLAVLKGMDRDASTAQWGPVGINPFSGKTMYADSDPRPGEVEVLGVGSLHSTPEGFSLKLLQGESYGVFGFGSLITGQGSRQYQVDSQKGTICVINDVGASSASGWGISQNPGHVETYTIDTVNGTIADYSKKAKNPMGAWQASWDYSHKMT